MRTDDFEAHARRFLQAQGYTNILQEPDGNVPPDLLVDSTIAVEVRRLNRNHKFEGGEYEGLQECRNQLTRLTRVVCEDLGGSESGCRWSVRLKILDFTREQRPEKKNKFPHFKKELELFLRTHRTSDSETPIKHHLERSGVHVIITPTNWQHPNQFKYGGVWDTEDSGWVYDTLEKNLRLCITEKTGRVAHHRHKYPEWWLVLGDFATADYTEEEYARFQVETRIEHGWDRVLLISPRELKLLAEW